MWVILLIIIFVTLVSTFLLIFIGKKKRTKILKEYQEERQAESGSREKKLSEARTAIIISVPELNDGFGSSQYLCGVINYPSLEMVKKKFEGTGLGTMSSDLDDWCFYTTDDLRLKKTGVEIVDFADLDLFIKEYRPYMGYSSLRNKKKTGKTFAKIKEEASK